ncbi:MAG: zinc ribbon domain-containing protein [Anaerolineaceae bacterium]
MSTFTRMPNYDIRNDGAGPYAVFYCESCNREFRSQPSLANALTQDLGRQAASGLLRKIPILGKTVADNVIGEDPRYSMKMTPAQVEEAWKQVQPHFRQCPTCERIVCLSDFDTQSGYCQDDSPRTNEIAEARGAQAGAAIKGFASMFGLDKVVEKAADAVQKAGDQMAHCPNCDGLAAAGTKFCPDCGTQMIQPVTQACPNCGADTHGAKFCPECGTKMEPAVKVTTCPACGAADQTGKFCQECGARMS